MKTFLMTAAIAAAAIPATAQAQVAVADLQAAVQQSAAFQTATTQMRTTYKAQIDAFTTRQTALNGELQPLIAAFQEAQKKPGATEAALKPQFDAIQTKRTAIQQQLAPLYQPIARVQAYVEEQVVAKLDQATRAAMTKHQIKVLLRPDAAFAYEPTANLTTAVVTELNTLVPTASITPPAGWEPGQEVAGEPAAGTPAATPPAKPQPQGR
ncbi:OmpH family outer membrane protein [Sphingomonas flavalba]|uniref:OmpH family outer membrane protein n=1 Tax=Sphingomonas flavalba TaxID=2559804 RepID=UPI00109D9786|nr:OmpH family outer membrane protein [Sphingomonas flavalba]